MKILLVEDEQISSLYLKALVERNGHDVVANVISGKEAIKAALNHTPDLILMDIILADNITGIQAVLAIHKVKYIPVIYISASIEIETLQSAKTTNMTAFLAKPIDERVLLFHIDNIASLQK